MCERFRFGSSIGCVSVKDTSPMNSWPTRSSSRPPSRRALSCSQARRARNPPRTWPPAPGVERRAGSERPPDVEGVDPADVPPVDADLLGQTVETPLHREVGLVAAEPAHRAGRWVVRVDGVRLDVHDRYVVGAAGVPAGPLQHFVANRGVGPGIAGETG